MSFALAANELNVTPAALSFQIKSLEEHLGEPVFRRLNRAVELTEAGRALAPGVTDGFAALNAAWRNARRLASDTTLTVTAGPALTAKWLAPRLFAFAQAHPEIELRFSATLRQMDFTRDEVDVALRYGLGPDVGVFSIPLVHDWMTPMMTPEVAQDYPTPADLSRALLMHDDALRIFEVPADWPVWFAANGLPPPPQGGPRFSQSDHALDAALTGGGVVLGRSVFAAKALREGRLVAPFPIAITMDTHFRFLCPQGHETRGPVRAFLDWIQVEMTELEELSQGRTIIHAKDAQP